MNELFSAAAAANDDVIRFLQDRAAATLPAYRPTYRATVKPICTTGYPVAALAVRFAAAVALCALLLVVFH